MAEQKAEECSSFRISYFAFTGRAQPIRNAAAIGGIAFEDRFVNSLQVKQEKEAGKRKWSGVPEMDLLDKDGKVVMTIGQSSTCLRYIGIYLSLHIRPYTNMNMNMNTCIYSGKLAGLYPKNPLQAALVDEIVDSIEDMNNVARKALMMEKAEEKEAAAKKLCEDGSDLRYWLDKFVNRLEERAKAGIKSGLCVTEEITIADLKLAETLGIMCQMSPPVKELLESKYKTNLMKVVEVVSSNDKVKEMGAAVMKSMGEFKALDGNKEGSEKATEAIYKRSGKYIAPEL